MLHNLLPATQRRQLRIDYRTRVAAVALFGLSCVFVLGSVALVPSYISLHSQISILQQEEQEFRNASRESAESARAALIADAERVAALGVLLSMAKPTDIIHDLLVLRSDAVAVTGISYDRQRAELSVQGVAATREALVSYVSALAAHEGFSSVSNPLANLARSTDLPFTLSISLASTDPSAAPNI